MTIFLNFIPKIKMYALGDKKYAFKKFTFVSFHVGHPVGDILVLIYVDPFFEHFAVS